MATPLEESYRIDDLLRKMGPGLFLNALFPFWKAFWSELGEDNAECPLALAELLADFGISLKAQAAALAKTAEGQKNSFLVIYLVRSGPWMSIVVATKFPQKIPVAMDDFTLRKLSLENMPEFFSAYPEVPALIIAGIRDLFARERAGHKDDLYRIEQIEAGL